MSKAVSDFWQYMDADGGYITVYAIEGHLEIVPHCYETAEAALDAARQYFTKKRFKVEVQRYGKAETDH